EFVGTCVANGGAPPCTCGSGTRFMFLLNTQPFCRVDFFGTTNVRGVAIEPDPGASCPFACFR
ncbi:MAG: hypothetical protein CL928_17640, partial [Deltaproteobacteria bacterium]|nr:hypothetical protein [Deltaproteobacteria bacterium]